MYNETSSALETTYGTNNINSVNEIGKSILPNPHPTNRTFAYKVENMPLGTYLGGSVGKTVVAKLLRVIQTCVWGFNSEIRTNAMNCNSFPCKENPDNPAQELVYKKLGTLPAWGDNLFAIIHVENDQTYLFAYKRRVL